MEFPLEGVLFMEFPLDRQQLFNIIVANTREVIPELEEHQFIQTDSLALLGANSIDRSEIIIMSLEKMSLEVPLTAFAGAKNIGELVELLHERTI